MTMDKVVKVNIDMKAERINAIIEAFDSLWIAIKAELKADEKIVIRREDTPEKPSVRSK